MINISTDSSKYAADELIRDNESFFDNNVAVLSFTVDSLAAMKTIDNAILLDKNTGKIETPFGIGSIDDLSSGCKTAINYIFIKESPTLYPNLKAISANERGYNALEELFRLVEQNNDGIEIVLQHNNKVYKCSDREYCIDGKHTINSMFDFYV